MGLSWLGIGCLPQHQNLVLWSAAFFFSLHKDGTLFHFLLLKSKNWFNEGIGCNSAGRVAKSVIISVPFSQIHWLTKAVSRQQQSVRYILPIDDKTGNCTAQRIAFECLTPATFKVVVFVCYSSPGHSVIPGWLSHCYKVHTEKQKPKGCQTSVSVGCAWTQP